MSKHDRAVFVVAIGVALGSPRAGRADTPVGGPICTDMHWTQAGSPYIVEDTITVLCGATVTIDPDVMVRFEPNVALVVEEGTLVARGSDPSPVQFTANQRDPNETDPNEIDPEKRWGYIQFSPNAVDATLDPNGSYSSGSILERVIVEYAGSDSGVGAVRAIESRPLIDGSRVQYNSTTGIYVEGAGAASIHLRDNTITGNRSPSRGGGVRVHYSASCTLTGNIITGNFASTSGGGVDLYYSEWTTLRDNTIMHNSASQNGGGVSLHWYSFSCTLTSNAITDNSASWDGGGVYTVYHCDFLALSNNIISRNSAGDDGGGLGFMGGNTDWPTLTSNIIDENSAWTGGGLYLANNGATLLCNQITANTAVSHGGAIYAWTANDVTLLGDRITNNHSNLPDGVGGIYLTDGADYWDLTGQNDPNDPNCACACVQIHGNDNCQLYNNNDFGGSTDCGAPGNVDARCVYWGTADPNQIEQGIYDFSDDPNKGVVCYDPYLSDECTCTLSISIVNALWGSVDVDPYIDLDPNASGYQYGCCTQVTLYAIPIQRKSFDCWRFYDPNHPGDANYVDPNDNDSNNPLLITMDTHYDIEAVFKCGSGIEPMLPVTLAISGLFLWTRHMRTARPERPAKAKVQEDEEPEHA